MVQTPTDWIEWQGGECPVRGDTLVEVRMGATDPEVDGPDDANCWLWQHTPDAVMGDYQVTAYRVVPA